MNINDFRTRVSEILSAQRVTTATPQDYAAHYTRAGVPALLLKSAAANRMRQYDGDYMNDPDEGRYFVDVMIRAAKESTHRHNTAFVERFTQLRTSRLLYSAYRKCTFLSSWTTAKIRPGAEESSDSLNHWRFYGDDGKGSCLIVPLSNLLTIFPDHLYRVCYGTERRGGGDAGGDRPVRQIERAIVARLNAMRVTESNAMEDLEEVIRELHPLIFLFKSDEYAAEGEVRSIVHKSDYSAAGGVLFDDRTNEPKRAYVDSNEGVISSGSYIYFGPKANRAYAIEAMGLAANLGIDLRVFVSSMPYR